MPKKKGKKGKAKGKKDKKKDKLSNLEHEIFLQTIAELEHKIAWRNHLCRILDEDIKLYKEHYEVVENDKIEAVHSLETEIVEEEKLCEKIQRAFSDAESRKRHAVADGAYELASKLLKIHEEKVSDETELQSLRRRLQSLENYNAHDVEQKITDIERKLESEDDEDILRKKRDQEDRREEAIKNEMKDILEHEAESMQAELGGRLDGNFERIAEETRWWEDRANGLRIASDRLESINRAGHAKLRSCKRELHQRKKVALRTSQDIKERDTDISDLIDKNKETQNKKRDDAEVYLLKLEQTYRNLKQRLDEEGEMFTRYLNEMEINENEIKELEEKLMAELSFEKDLNVFIGKAAKLLEEEAKYSLILTCHGPPKTKKTVEELRNVFAEATNFIYNRGKRRLL